MVNSFIGNLIQAKDFVCVVFISLLLVHCMCALKFGQLGRPNDLCNKCREENRKLAFLLATKGGDNRRHSCVFSKLYLRCAEPLETKCRQDIHFQAGMTLMRSQMEKNNCESMNITWSEVLKITNKIRQSGKVNAEPGQCRSRRPKLKPVYKVCGLFGDPHLRTFSDKRHTCSVPGAWPLFANRYLTVQVTNIPLENSSRATATSKVTVIVRGMKRKCIEEKTYQARSFSLPSTFTDGTKSSSDKDCATTVTQLERRRRITIDICALKTKIIIRQVGKYLTVHMRVPKGLTRRKTIGLCQRGCPRFEQMNLDKMSRIDNVIASLFKPDKLSRRVKRERQERARRLCGAAKVTGFYYKSCLFDMLTSDDASFVKAARKAMKDFRAVNKDDKGRPIVNETDLRDVLVEPTKPQTTLRTTYIDTTLVPSSSAFMVHKTSFSLVLLTLVMQILLVFR